MMRWVYNAGTAYDRATFWERHRDADEWILRDDGSMYAGYALWTPWTRFISDARHSKSDDGAESV